MASQLSIIIIGALTSINWFVILSNNEPGSSSLASTKTDLSVSNSEFSSDSDLVDSPKNDPSHG